jgi:methionyl-tRNA formyltransferase
MRLAFFGTPEFAVPSLRALLGEGFDVAAVITRPDRPRGRSRSVRIPPPVKLVADQEGLPVLQPEQPRGPEFEEALRQLAPDLGVVVAYGHLLRPEILAIPRLGMVNLHASLLPRWRGAAPIPWTILAGDEVTGVSVMQMDAGLDTGPVLHRIETEIPGDETAGELSVRLAELGAAALVEALMLLAAGKARPEPQDEARATYAPKITRQTSRLDWTRDAASLARAIRAFDPEPGAWALLDGTEIKFFGGRAINGAGPPGTVLAAEPLLRIGTGLGALEVQEVQPAGRKRMTAAAWARGRGVAVGQRFT